VLRGKEPLMKVRLARLADGDVLGVTLSHCVTGKAGLPLLTDFARTSCPTAICIGDASLA